MKLRDLVAAEKVLVICPICPFSYAVLFDEKGWRRSLRLLVQYSNRCETRSLWHSQLINSWYWWGSPVSANGNTPSKANQLGVCSLIIDIYCLLFFRRCLYTVLITVDARQGVVSSLFYSKGTTIDKYFLFTTLVLLPPLEDPGKRVITFDNLSSHTSEEVPDCISSIWSLKNLFHRQWKE